MAQGYQHWFDIVFNHGYFAGRVCRPLTLLPTAACLQLLRRYRLLFRPLPGGAQVYYDPTDPLQLLARFDETLPFTFAIHCDDPALLSYTADRPTPTSDSTSGLYYFDNLSGAAFVSDGGDNSALKAGQSLLHAPGLPFGSGELVLRPRRFIHRNTKPGALLTVCARDDAPVWWADAHASGDVTITLAGIADGRYSLRSGSETLLNFYLSDTIVASRQWGVVAIYAVPGRAAGVYPLDKDGSTLRRQFRIMLESRRCIWCYCVVARTAQEGRPNGTVEVSDRRNGALRAPLAFELQTGAAAKLLEGLPVACFNSSVPLALEETPSGELSFTFNQGAQGDPRGSGRKLPYARASSLVRADDATRELRAEMYVYL